MAVFSQRRRGYKTGVFMLFASVAMAIWGVIAPGWMTLDTSAMGYGVYIYAGLWFTCQDHLADCMSNDFSAAYASTYATLALSILGLVVLLSSCLLALRANCCVRVISHSRLPEVSAMIAGLCLFIACMVYLGDSVSFVVDFPGTHYGPSFFLTLTAAVGSGVAGILLSIYNRSSGSYYTNPTFFIGSSRVMPTSNVAYPVQYQTFTPPESAPGVFIIPGGMRWDSGPIKTGHRL